MHPPQNPLSIATWFVGGAADKSRFWLVAPQTNLIRNQLIFRYFQEISQNGQLAQEVNTGLESAYYAYDEMTQLLQAIIAIHKHNPSVNIRLIGHSLGGWQVAALSDQLHKAGIHVALLITIDPVGISYFMNFPGGQYSLPRPKATVWINLSANHQRKYTTDDAVADAGIRWFPARYTGLKRKPDLDISIPYSHAAVWEMMAFPGGDGKSAWQMLTTK